MHTWRGRLGGLCCLVRYTPCHGDLRSSSRLHPSNLRRSQSGEWLRSPAGWRNRKNSNELAHESRKSLSSVSVGCN
ncbi:hypothetical protein CDV36_016515 [Fusarium kuroshium]|uniref:Uncharacterized protein n=1 Tax=Fusarium kuroshium TaxID=2010991 RepID=A0A3M2QLK0_9HYPO|nr:hypothetical protein CDV36_016515 [Fusarium kuroshium]